MNHSDELWQEFTVDGQPIVGAGHPKGDFDDKRLICGTVHIWLWRVSSGVKEVLLQKRSMTKTIAPGKWDISSAGHINLGETTVDAALREVKEELGFRIDPKRLYFIMAEHTKFHSIRNVFLYQVEPDTKFTFFDGEVDSVKWVSIPEFRQILHDDEGIVGRSPAYYESLFDNLELL